VLSSALQVGNGVWRTLEAAAIGAAVIVFGAASASAHRDRPSTLVHVQIPADQIARLRALKLPYVLIPTVVPAAFGSTTSNPFYLRAGRGYALGFFVPGTESNPHPTGGTMAGEVMRTPRRCTASPRLGESCHIFHARGTTVALYTGSGGYFYDWHECGMDFTANDNAGAPRPEMKAMIDKLRPLAPCAARLIVSDVTVNLTPAEGRAEGRARLQLAKSVAKSCAVGIAVPKAAGLFGAGRAAALPVAILKKILSAVTGADSPCTVVKEQIRVALALHAAVAKGAPFSYRNRFVHVRRRLRPDLCEWATAVAGRWIATTKYPALTGCP
jgi:hypothetical protein